MDGGKKLQSKSVRTPGTKINLVSFSEAQVNQNFFSHGDPPETQPANPTCM